MHPLRPILRLSFSFIQCALAYQPIASCQQRSYTWHAIHSVRGTIMTHPRHYAAETPSKIAAMMSDGSDSIDYGTLEKRANQAAHYFRSLGLNRGDTVAFWLPNCIAIYEIFWAAQRSGLYLTPIATQLTAAEAEYIIRNSGAKFLLSSGEVAGFAALNYSDNIMVQTPDQWATTLAKQPATPVGNETPGVNMMYSSGTTGKPKGIRLPLPEGGIADNVAFLQLVQHYYGCNSEDVYLSPAPLYHAAPLVYTTGMMRMGMTVVVMRNFDAAETLRLIEKHRITVMQMVPTMFVRMLKLPDEERLQHDISSLRAVIHAAAPCPVQVKQQMMDWFGPVIYEYYAGSEGNGATLISPQEWLERPGSVGKATLGRLRICDDDGDEVPAETPGTVYFDSEYTFEYLGDKDKTADSRNPKHPTWTTLGDIGYVDSEGYLFLTDRRSYMIISGGVNIYPQEIENLLITHPRVLDAAVIGVPNSEFGEEVKAVVQPLDPDDTSDDFAAELMAFCKDHLSHVKCPRSVDFDLQLPRLDNGKLYKRLVRDRYWKDAAAG